MKLATLRNGTRDGQLVVVSRDLSKALPARHVAPTMVHAIENWSRVKGALTALYVELSAGRIDEAVKFDISRCLAPLPRAPRWLVGLPANAHFASGLQANSASDDLNELRLYQGAADSFLSATEDIHAASERDEVDFVPKLAVAVDDVPRGIGRSEASRHIKLLMLSNCVCLQAYASREIDAKLGFVHTTPATMLAPIAITSDELDDTWCTGRVHLPFDIRYNGKAFATEYIGSTSPSFFDVIAYGAKTRSLSAGTLVASAEFAGAGAALISECRRMETAHVGRPRTPYMRFGDRLRIEVLNHNGESLFGAIDTSVQSY